MYTRTVLHYSCQHQQRQQCHLLKAWKANYLPAYECVFVCICTYSEVSERRPLKASAAMSEIWFLLKSLGTSERGVLGALIR